jgi:hypothetical protein
MFEASDPEVIVDLNRLLPPSGDNRSVVTLDGGVLNVDVFFNAQSHEGEDSIRLSFEDTVAVVVSVAPGVSVTNLKCEGAGPTIGSVVEFRKSAAATAWMEAMPWKHRKTRQFMLFLMQQGRLLHVFAADCRVSSGQDQPKE